MIKSCRALLSLILSLIFFQAVHAQKSHIPAPISVTIDSYKSKQELPQPKWMIKEGRIPLSIENILEGDIKDGQVIEIHPDEIMIEQFEKYWLAIEFISEMDLQNWLLHVENPISGFGWVINFSEIQSFAIQEGKLIDSGMTGYFVPVSKRDFNSRHTQSLLNLNLSSGSKMTLWVHIKKNYTVTSSFPRLTIYEPSVSLPDFNRSEDILFWVGTIFMAWILSLIIFLYLRDRASIWFFVFVTALILDTLANMPSDPLTRLFYPENPKLGLYMGIGTSVLMMASFLQFARVFIDLPSKNLKLNKVISSSILVYIFASIVLLYLFFYYENSTFSKGWFLLFNAIYLGSGITYLFLKDTLSKIIGLAILLFISPNLVPLPFGEGFLPVLALLLTATLGVGYRIKILFQDRLQAEREKKDLLTHQNTLLENQVAERTAELSHSLNELKSTQAQLVQQEKLASLGQLTAGIAHEIKNPLNFVNNFSGVSLELVDEALEEIEKVQEERDEALIRDNMVDIRSNLQKVHEHGTRANGIVTSMLQHSRGSSGKLEPADLNALIKEYVNLSFHGMRAGKNPINVELAFDLDPKIQELPLIKEDFVRVIINLCNNAFDAMRSKTNSEFIIHNSELYHPKLTVGTKAEKDFILIEVEDNGPGIPEEIKDKILQPFFTTKKGTEGTGLGLSITHDIVKAHGGDLAVETSLNNYTKFSITLKK